MEVGGYVTFGEDLPEQGRQQLENGLKWCFARLFKFRVRKIAVCSGLSLNAVNET